MCLNGKCVSDHENAIDYGDGFLRRTGSVEVETYVKKNGYQDTSSSTRLDILVHMGHVSRAFRRV